MYHNVFGDFRHPAVIKLFLRLILLHYWGL